MKKTIYSLALGLTAVSYAIAQDSTAAKPADSGKFTINGYIDSYYLTSFNNPKSGNLSGYHANYGGPGSDGTTIYYGFGRAFDRLTDQFALGLVQMRLAYTTSKSEMVIDLTFGPNASLGNFGNNAPYGTYNGTYGGYANGYFPINANQAMLYGAASPIKQAYFKYNITDKLSFTVGQFGTHIGYEVIDAPVNFHYSLSNLFNNGPFYHVGGKINYSFSDKFGVMAGVVNNWDALTDWKKQKSVIGQVFLSPISGLNIYLNYIIGHNDDGFKVARSSTVPSSGYGPFSGSNPYYSGPSYTRQLIDLTLGYQITDKFYLGLNAAYGAYSFNTSTEPVGVNKAAYYALPGDPAAGVDTTTTESDWAVWSYGSNGPSWYGAALYATYKINDVISIGIRGEHFNDKNAVRYIAAVNNSFTATIPITLAEGHVIIKPEFRMDMASSPAGSASAIIMPKGLFEDKDGNATWNQQTFGCAFIYKY
ncbi:MAG: outer membrane beta-barrel protein [Cytophagales bacterium]|nr:outer membrane beta-barrel protein [Cytophagales bacterium]